jgi:hypothetical protein
LTLAWASLFAGERLAFGAGQGLAQSIAGFVGSAIGLCGRVVVAFSVAFCALANQVDGRGVSRAREGGLGPFAGELIGAARDAGPLDGGALGAVGGERVGMFEIAGDVFVVEGSWFAGIGLEQH